MTNMPIESTLGRFAITLTSDFENPLLKQHIPLKEIWSESVPALLQKEASEALASPVTFQATAFIGLSDDEFEVRIELQWPSEPTGSLVEGLLEALPDKIVLTHIGLGPVGKALALFHVPDEGITETVGAEFAYIPASGTTV